ncbi:hypothetical protein DFH11DRAFT_1726302 [Phellopilus nigrolimitatus]|nr:hypothetical protein DFH11DRAFT_1726302 [Phellopilus nigrolimitatus]
MDDVVRTARSLHGCSPRSPPSAHDFGVVDEIEEKEARELAPPRLRFLADSAARASWSSQDSSLYAPSDATDSGAAKGYASEGADEERRVNPTLSQSQKQKQKQRKTSSPPHARAPSPGTGSAVDVAERPPRARAPPSAFRTQGRNSFPGPAAAVADPLVDATGMQKIEQNLCSVLDDDFSTFDTNTWHANCLSAAGELQMTTDTSENLYIKNGQLYIMRTLTLDEIGAFLTCVSLRAGHAFSFLATRLLSHSSHAVRHRRPYLHCLRVKCVVHLPNRVTLAMGILLPGHLRRRMVTVLVRGPDSLAHLHGIHHAGIRLTTTFRRHPNTIRYLGREQRGDRERERVRPRRDSDQWGSHPVKKEHNRNTAVSAVSGSRLGSPGHTLPQHSHWTASGPYGEHLEALSPPFNDDSLPADSSLSMDSPPPAPAAHPRAQAQAQAAAPSRRYDPRFDERPHGARAEQINWDRLRMDREREYSRRLRRDSRWDLSRRRDAPDPTSRPTSTPSPSASTPYAPVLHAFVALLATVLTALSNPTSLDFVIPLPTSFHHFSCNLPLDDPAICSFLQRLPAMRGRSVEGARSRARAAAVRAAAGSRSSWARARRPQPPARERAPLH